MSRIAPVLHARRAPQPDPAYVAGLSEMLRASYTPDALLDLYSRFVNGTQPLDALMRRCIWRALCRACGDGLNIGQHVLMKHLETFEIGSNVTISPQSYIQGHHDGRCVLGNYVWIGPQVHIDARDLVLEDYVGLASGTKILSSTHTGQPPGEPYIRTDVEIQPVRMCYGAMTGVNAVIFPGVTVGRNSFISASSIVTRDVPPDCVVAGTPARVVKRRRPEGETAQTNESDG